MRGKLVLTFSILIFLSLLIIPLSYAKVIKEPGWSEEEKLAYMLERFDNQTTYHKGIIVVVFTEDTTKEIATDILDNYNLTIQQVEVCGPIEGVTRDVNEEGGGSGEPTSEEDQTCEIQDSWDDSLKLAHVIVLEGKEKESAELLINEDIITWIAPESIITTLGEDEPATEQQEQQELDEEEKEEYADEKLDYLYYLIPFVIILLVIVILKMRKRKN